MRFQHQHLDSQPTAVRCPEDVSGVTPQHRPSHQTGNACHRGSVTVNSCEPLCALLLACFYSAGLDFVCKLMPFSCQQTSSGCTVPTMPGVALGYEGHCLVAKCKQPESCPIGGDHAQHVRQVTTPKSSEPARLLQKPQAGPR